MSEANTQQMGVPKTALERGKIAPAKFAHIVYKTSRYEEMMAWYRTVLEAEVVMSSPAVSFLSYDDEHHRIALINMPDLADKPGNAAGVDHCAFTYGSLDDLLATYERLSEHNIKPYWCVNHGPTLSMYYQDPDHNQVELQIDIFETNEEVTDWFQHSDFDTNPIGVRFDPDSFIERFRSGEDRATLLKRPKIDPSELAAQFPS